MTIDHLPLTIEKNGELCSRNYEPRSGELSRTTAAVRFTVASASLNGQWSIVNGKSKKYAY